MTPELVTPRRVPRIDTSAGRVERALAAIDAAGIAEEPTQRLLAARTRLSRASGALAATRSQIQTELQRRREGPT